MSSLVSNITLQFKDNFSSGFKSATSSMGASQAKVSQAAKQIQNGNGMMSIARDMSVVSMQMGQLTNQIKSFTAVPGLVASSFEDSMGRVSTVLNESNAVGGNTVKSMAMIKDAAERMAGGVSDAGKLASVGTDTFASSVYTMLSSGLRVEAGIAGTEQASLLAKATGGNMAVAGSLLTGVYNNLGNKTAEAGAEMTRLSDIVAGTQNYFAFENLEQFSSGFANVSSVAKMSGVSLSQVSASLGQLNSNMIVGPQAGTALKSVIAQLGNASQKLGFDIAKTSNGGLDLIKTFENINKVGADGAELIKAFGSEAAPAVGALTGNLGELKKGYDYVNNSAGITLQNASKMADTLTTKQSNLNNAMKVFQGRVGAGSNAVKGMGVSLQLGGVKLLNWATNIPVVGGAVAGLTGGVIELGGSLSGVANFALQSSTGLLSFISLIQQAPAILTMMKGSLSMVGLSLKGLSAGIVSAGKGFIAGIPGVISWASSMWAAAAAHMAVAWPIYAVIAGIALLVTGIILLVKNWDKVKACVVGVWNKVVGAFKRGFNFVKSLFTESPVWIQVALLAFAPFIAIPMQVIKHWDTIKIWFSAFTGWIVSVPGRIKTAFVSGLNFITGAFGRGFNFVKSLFTESPVWVQVALMAFAPFIAIPMQVIKHWDTLKGWFSSFVDWIVGVAGKVTAPFKFIADSVAKLFGKDSGKKITETMASGMRSDNSLYNATSESFNKVDKLIPHSNAPEGPFSRLTHAGAAIPGTMASGMNGDRSLYNATSREFGEVGKIIQFPNLNKKGGTGDKSIISQLKALLKNTKSKNGDTTNNYNVTISFDDLKELPSLIEYLTLLKEETDREEAV